MKLNGLEQYFKKVNGEIVDFNQMNNSDSTPLMISLCCNKVLNLNLTSEQWNYLIQNSDLKQINK